MVHARNLFVSSVQPNQTAAQLLALASSARASAEIPLLYYALLHAMSYEGQTHHPHKRGNPPNAHLIDSAGDTGREPYIPAGLALVQAHWYTRHGERSP